MHILFYSRYRAALLRGTTKVRDSDGKECSISGKHSRFFAYENGIYDPEDPLKGYLKGELLVKVSISSSSWYEFL